MKNLPLRAFSLNLTLAAFSFASAVPIRYTVEGVGSGRLDGIDFTDRAVSLTALSDTSAVTLQSGFYFAPLTTNTISVEGVGVDSILGPLGVASEPGSSFVGFGAIQLPDGGPAVFSVLDRALSGYDLRSSIGPIGGFPAYTPQLEVATGGGVFRLDYVSSASFAAQVVPEPAPFAALSLGILALRLRRRS